MYCKHSKCLKNFSLRVINSCLWYCVSIISWDPYGGELAVLFLKLLQGKDLTTSSDLRQSNFHKDMGDRQGKQVLLGSNKSFFPYTEWHPLTPPHEGLFVLFFTALRSYPVSLASGFYFCLGTKRWHSVFFLKQHSDSTVTSPLVSILFFSIFTDHC